MNHAEQRVAQVLGLWCNAKNLAAGAAVKRALVFKCLQMYKEAYSQAT